MGKYWITAWLAFRRRLTSIPDLSGRAVLYFIILGVWWKIWNATEFSGFAGFSPTSALWYLAGTEWIVLSIPYVYLDMENDIRSGDYTFSWLRPGHYTLYQLANAFGLATANWIILGVLGLLIAFGLTGAVPDLPAETWLGMATLGWFSLMTSCLVMVSLGLLSVWTFDSSPYAWVWQKLQFVAGGLMLPLAIYPGWLVELAQASPFPHLLGNIIAPIIGDSSRPFVIAGGAVAMWFAIFAVGLGCAHRGSVARTLEG